MQDRGFIYYFSFLCYDETRICDIQNRKQVLEADAASDEQMLHTGKE